MKKNKGRSYYQIAIRRLVKDKMAMFCLAIIILYSATAILAGLGLIARGYDQQHPDEAYKSPSTQHLLGTDLFGRSVLQRVIQGTKISMSVGLVTSLIAVPIGIILGAIAGYFGGKVDEVIVWFYSVLISVPGLLLILALAMVLGRGIVNVYIAIGITTWVGLCRLIRAEFMKHKKADYVLAARSLGAGHIRCIFHILPNVLHLAIINFTLRFGAAIRTEVILSYLGVGVVNQPSWGIMISDARLELLRGYWWQLAAATAAMFIISLAINIFGDSLRDALDPKLQGE